MEKYFKNWNDIFKHLNVWKISDIKEDIIEFCAITEQEYISCYEDVKINAIYFDFKSIVLEVPFKYFSVSEIQILFKLKNFDLRDFSISQIDEIIEKNLSQSFFNSDGDLKLK